MESTAATPRIGLAANRQIGCEVLELLLLRQLCPVVLLLPSGGSAGPECDRMLQRLPGIPVLRGDSFRRPNGLKILREADLDYVLSIHFPYLIPQSVLSIPRVGTLNLHPSYLPYNRGWHTPTWSIIDETPYGATLHWVEESLDSGDIAMQKRVDVLPDDTANSLYKRVLAAEVQLMCDAIPRILDHSLPRLPQCGNATEHRKADLSPIQELRLSEVMSVDQILRRLRGLTTNRWDEAPYFERNGVRYRVRVEISKEPLEGVKP